MGFGFGLVAHRFYAPLTSKILKLLGRERQSDPFHHLSPTYKILAAPFICVIGPIIEEQFFRGDLHKAIKDKCKSFYRNQGYSHADMNHAARITAVFFSSIIFGIVHFSNAIVFRCHPIFFLPQVIAATIMGIMFSMAREFSGKLDMPIGMHIGNNVLAWVNMMKKV